MLQLLLRDVISSTPLAGRSDASRVRVTLIESDTRNVSVAREAARAARLDHVVVREADAGELCTYDAAVPADLVVMVGAVGNISDVDVRKTTSRFPDCARNA